MKDKKTFGSFIKRKRESKNYSQKDLAELLYVTESAVSKWERGVSYPDITLITDICKVLDISERELIQSSDDDEYRRIKRNSDKFNKIKKTLFWVFNIVYVIAIITCFIVNLTTEHKLTWFFIVLMSILVSYTFCPTLTWINEKYKLVIFIGTNIISLFLLFLTCSIYTNNYWFMIPTMGILLGYFIIFYPILFNKQKTYLTKEKYNDISKWFLLSYLLGMFILIILLLVFIYVYKSYNLLLGIMITISIFTIPIIFGIINIFAFRKSNIKFMIITIVNVLLIFNAIGIIASSSLRKSITESTHLIMYEYQNIKIQLNDYDIRIHLNDSENKIVYNENKKVKLQVEDNETLLIKQVDNRNFFEKFNSSRFMKLDIYLAKETCNNLEIKNNTGNIIIDKGFEFDNVNITNTTGNVDFKSQVKDALKIETSTGDIIVNDVTVLNQLELKVNTGKINLYNIRCGYLNINSRTGDVKITNAIVKYDCNLNGRTTDVSLEDFDAKNIYIVLSTGDVSGTILSNKIFDVKSNTGKVNIPKSREGGDCVIKVSTGDIDIRYK